VDGSALAGTDVGNRVVRAIARATRFHTARKGVGVMRRFVALVVVFSLVFSMAGFSGPEPAQAIVLELVGALAFNQAAAAAGATYTGATGASLAGAGITPRQAYGLQALAIRSGTVTLAQAGTSVMPGVVMAMRAGMMARGVWDAFTASVASAYSYGSYAWLELTQPYTYYLALQAQASVGGLGTVSAGTGLHVSTGLPQLLAPSWVLSGTASADDRMLFQMMQLACTAGASSLLSFRGVTTGNPAAISWWIDDSNYITGVVTPGFGGWPWYGGTPGCTITISGGIASASVLALMAAHDGGPISARWSEAPAPKVTAADNTEGGKLIKGPWPDPTPTPDPGSSPFYVPLSPDWTRNPATLIGTPDGVATGSGATPVTPDNPVPYTPQPGTPTIPVPPPGRKLGDAAKAAATAMVADAGILGWLVTPFQALLNAIGDVLNFLQDCWNTIVGWVSGLFWPGPEGMALHFTTPWANLTSSFAGRWPFAGAAVVSAIFTPLFSPPMTGTHTFASSWTVNFNGANVSMNLDSWLAPLTPYRWFFVAAIWLWFLVAVWRFWTPQVVT
jgi:hypothetical protein